MNNLLERQVSAYLSSRRKKHSKRYSPRGTLLVRNSLDMHVLQAKLRCRLRHRQTSLPLSDPNLLQHSLLALSYCYFITG